IVFDINFAGSVSRAVDQEFAQMIQKAGNVVLYEHLRKKRTPLRDSTGTINGILNIEERVPPLEVLAQSAAALAPFPLPKVPVKVSQCWAFKTGAGDIPTLPVAAFQLFTLDVYPEFIRTIKQFDPGLAMTLPGSKIEIIREKATRELIITLRNEFLRNASMSNQIQAAFQGAVPSSGRIENKQRLVESLVNMYRMPDSFYLNFYGPPGTIPTFSYAQVLWQEKQMETGQNGIDFKNKAVFIGHSDQIVPNKKDGFYTAFSQSSGIDISGVEMAATAFANFEENMPVRIVSPALRAAIIVVGGAVLACICIFLSPGFAILSILGMGMVYVSYILFRFTFSGHWYPLVIPLFFQPVLAFIGAAAWKYADIRKDRQDIRRALGYYLPGNLADQLVKNISKNKETRQIVHGTCLFTDAGQYTAMSEAMDPQTLHSFMNQYYKILFEQVKKHKGIVINVVGDAMLAIWAKNYSDDGFKHGACAAALDISNASFEFTGHKENIRFPTRIGLHHGDILMGDVGAVDHYEFRPTGDIVNTASRLEGLNKYLGTNILVSAQVMDQVDGFLTRDVGRFYLVGKSKAVRVHELVCRLENATDRQRRICRLFSKALQAYQNQLWEEAMDYFNQTIRVTGQDGPSFFYLKQIEKRRHLPANDIHDDAIRMARK
ncbi:MAG: CHASE2 domain-containing protein, partial [Desulfobacterales bacterium]|nr:CHASE2 domain-containing protein [Desulfobacterales bacterium]